MQKTFARCRSRVNRLQISLHTRVCAGWKRGRTMGRTLPSLTDGRVAGWSVFRACQDHPAHISAPAARVALPWCIRLESQARVKHRRRSMDETCGSLLKSVHSQDTLHYVYRSSEDAPYRPIDPHRDTPHQLLIDAINNEVVRRRTDAEQIARQAKAMAREATLTASKARGSNNPHGLSLASPNISSLPNASQRAPVKPKSTQAGQVKVEKASETVPSSSRDPKVEEIARNVGDTSQPSPRGTFHAANSSKPVSVHSIPVTSKLK